MSTYTLGDNQYTYISSNTSTQVFTGSGVIVGILVGTTAAGAIQVIDGVSGSTTNVGELKSSIAEGYYPFGNGIQLKLGCLIITAASPKITVVWQQN